MVPSFTERKDSGGTTTGAKGGTAGYKYGRLEARFFSVAAFVRPSDRRAVLEVGGEEVVWWMDRAGAQRGAGWEKRAAAGNLKLTGVADRQIEKPSSTPSKAGDMGAKAQRGRRCAVRRERSEPGRQPEMRGRGAWQRLG